MMIFGVGCSIWKDAFALGAPFRPHDIRDCIERGRYFGLKSTALLIFATQFCIAMDALTGEVVLMVRWGL